MSVAIGASRHRRARLHGDGEPGAAVHGRGALQRLGPRAADRDDRRQPRDRRTDQHLERPHRLDVPARLRLDPALRRDQPGGASTCTSRRSGWPRSCRMPVMVCMDGFILTHAVERVDVPDQEQVDAFLPPFEPRQVLDPDEPVSIGAMVGPEAFTEVKYLAHAKQMQALELIPEIAADFEQRVRPRLRRADPHLPRRGRRDDRRRARLGARDDQGHRRRAARATGVKIGAVGITSFRPFPLDAVREALGHAPARGRAREGARRRHRRDRHGERAHGARRHRRCTATP